ncbi:hypothetical protein IC620_16005 [Hazenella sp. IB182357]|uniref:Uncharacterized protein n=1 Tax=Polycladospora coralii TaxID=2771432 RepID=A0A926N736_9BACL|nr:hypothetical protein [Polycladospora coralii]MBD1373849.1 hypothetical protein [Polycladospora coralii]
MGRLVYSTPAFFNINPANPGIPISQAVRVELRNTDPMYPMNFKLRLYDETNTIQVINTGTLDKNSITGVFLNVSDLNLYGQFAIEAVIEIAQRSNQVLMNTVLLIGQAVTDVSVGQDTPVGLLERFQLIRPRNL